MRLSGFQQLRQLQLLLLGREALKLFQQVGTANQVYQTLHAALVPAQWLRSAVNTCVFAT